MNTQFCYLLFFSGLLCAHSLHALEKSFIDDSGFKITFNAPPKRIISVAPNLTEIINSIGKIKSLIGVSEYSNYPASIKQLPKVGSYAKPNVEIILSMNPDLVLMVREGPPKFSVEKLRSLGIMVAILNSPDFPSVLRNTRRLAEILDVSEEGNKVATRLQQKYTAIRQVIKNQPKAKVLYVIALQPIMTVGNGSFLHNIIEHAGAINVARKITTPYPRVSLESVIAWQPEIILFSSGMGREASAQLMKNYWQQWPNIPAVKNKRFVEINADLINRAGPRLAQALSELAMAFHPEQASDIRNLSY